MCLSFKLGFKRQNFHVIATVVKLAEVSYIAAEDWGVMLLHIALFSLLLYAKLHHISPSQCLVACVVVCLFPFLSHLFFKTLTAEANTVFTDQQLSACEVPASSTYYITWMLSPAQQQTFHHV